MSHTPSKKLALHRETLRTLSGSDIDGVYGGFPNILTTTTTGDGKITIQKLTVDTTYHFGKVQPQPRWNDTIAHPNQIHVRKSHYDDTLAHPTQVGKAIPL